MEPLTPHRGLASAATASAFAAVLTVASLVAIGCASPGPPRAPSLHLPQTVTDLTATRVGDAVELRFTVPHLSTDKLPLYSAKRPNQVLHGTLCRELDRHDCVAVAGLTPTLTAGDHHVLTLREPIPAEFTTGAPHLLGYRVEFYNDEGRSAGRSEAAFTATGPIPAPVAGLRASGTRGGILLQWDPAARDAGEVLLQRIELNPKAVEPKVKPKAEAPAKPASRKMRGVTAGKLPKARSEDNEIWLNANSARNETLDATVTADEPYRYVAVRRRIVAVGARTFDLRSEASAPVDFTLGLVYAPAMPSGLTATGFQPPEAAPGAPPAHYSVDLIWQPVDDANITPQLAAPLVGYNIYREELSADGSVSAARARLNATPVPLPAFHDATATAAGRYRYSVTSIDSKGNESKAAVFMLEPSPQ